MLFFYSRRATTTANTKTKWPPKTTAVSWIQRQGILAVAHRSYCTRRAYGIIPQQRNKISAYILGRVVLRNISHTYHQVHNIIKIKKTTAVRSRILSKLIFASCVGYFDRAYYGFYWYHSYHTPLAMEKSGLENRLRVCHLTCCTVTGIHKAYD